MGKYNALNAALKYLRNVGNSEDTPVPNAPAGTQLARYQDYKAGKINVNYVRSAGSNPGDLEEVDVKPFAVAAASTTLAMVDYSQRARNNIGQTGLSVDALNHVATSANSSRIISFVPARATVVIYGLTDGVATTSKITGRPYKKRNNTSYTYPFGQGADAPNYAAAKAAIANAVAAGNTNRGVSFKPEVYR
ncbi:hypothetical protein [Mastigocladopsis repens]|uniref:hypothetical protein n=1 Tax=Mastigocladopsis repens TaxID=221287 RepID=UPI000310CA39|nr:hypothetical protein [Mastigocladopsis repens]